MAGPSRRVNLRHKTGGQAHHSSGGQALFASTGGARCYDPLRKPAIAGSYWASDDMLECRPGCLLCAVRRWCCRRNQKAWFFRQKQQPCPSAWSALLDPVSKNTRLFPPSSAMRIQKSEDSKLSAVSSQHSVLIALSFALCLKARRAAPNDLNERNVLNDPNDPNQPNQFNQSN